MADAPALIDVGTKVFSRDKPRVGISGHELTFRSIVMEKGNEEHGYLCGEELNQVAIGQRLRFVAQWNVEARGCSV